MNQSLILRHRLQNQKIIKPEDVRPEEIIRWLGAIQAQDYVGAKWAIGLRSKSISDTVVESAIDEGKIVRAWPLRGTLHFTHAEDLRWMVRLTKKHLIAKFSTLYKQRELDNRTFQQSFKILYEILKDGSQLTREEIASALERKKIKTNTERLSHILYRAGAEEIICFAKRREKQFTYTLLDHWIPDNKGLDNPEEGVHRLAMRYFLSRGPATIDDFVWWSGLPKSVATSVIDSLRLSMTEEKINGTSVWFQPSEKTPMSIASKVFILPGFDEYVLAYSDRNAVLNPAYKAKVIGVNGLFSPTVIINGKVTATWKRIVSKDNLLINVQPLEKISKEDMTRTYRKAKHYADFLGLTLKTS